MSSVQPNKQGNKTGRTVATRGGLSLVEVVVSTAIVGVMIVGALNTVGMAYKTRKLTANRLPGPGLAQRLMTEVLSMSYQDPQSSSGSIGLDSGESGGSTRSDFDDVDDYNGWNSADAKAKDGTTLTGFTGWQQQIQVAWVQVANPATTSAAESGLKRITVTVTSPTGAATTLVGLRGRKGALEQAPAIDTTAVCWIGASMRAGAATRSEQWGSQVDNHADDVN